MHYDNKVHFISFNITITHAKTYRAVGKQFEVQLRCSWQQVHVDRVQPSKRYCETDHIFFFFFSSPKPRQAAPPLTPEVVNKSRLRVL